MLTPLLSLFLACPPPSKDSDSTPTESQIDTDTGQDSEESPPPDPDIAFDLSGDWNGGTLSLTWLDASSLGGETLIFGDVFLHADAEARVEITTEAPDASFLQEFAPEVMAAWFVPALHTDADGDGIPSGEEPYLGVATTWLLYLDAEPPDNIMPGLKAGWNGLQMDFVDGGDEMVVVDPLTIPVDANLAVKEQLTLSGTWSEGFPEDSGLAVVSALATAANPVLWDAPSQSPWTIELDGPPPEDHFDVLQGANLYAALEVGIGYQDSDRSGDYTSGDFILHTLCADSDALGVLYLPAPTDLLTALMLGIQGNSPGWLGLRMNQDGAPPLTDAELQNLDVSSACSLEEG